LLDQAERSEGAESMQLLGQAVNACRASLEVRTRMTLPNDWAESQKNLGNALRAQGERSEGAESVQLLNQAVVALHGALEVFTAEAFPYDDRLARRDAKRAEELLQRRQEKQANSETQTSQSPTPVITPQRGRRPASRRL